MRTEATNKIGFHLVNIRKNNRLPQLVLPHQPYGKRYVGRPRRRWREQDHLKANEFRKTVLRSLNLQRS